MLVSQASSCTSTRLLLSRLNPTNVVHEVYRDRKILRIVATARNFPQLVKGRAIAANSCEYSFALSRAWIFLFENGGERQKPRRLDDGERVGSKVECGALVSHRCNDIDVTFVIVVENCQFRHASKEESTRIRGKKRLGNNSIKLS